MWGQRFPHPHDQPEGTVVVVEGRDWVVTHHDWVSSRDGHPMCGCGWALIEDAADG